MTDAKLIGTVAQFIMTPRRRLELFSLTVLTSKYDCIIRDEYNANWSKKYGYIFDMRGSGGGRTVTVSGPYFVWGDVKIKEEPIALIAAGDEAPWTSPATLKIRERNQTRRLARLPRQFRGHGHNVLEWLEENGIQEDSVYCSICGDCMPATGYDYCEHVWWCDRTAWYSTPNERCGCKDRDECFDDKTLAAAIRDAMDGGQG